MNEEESDRNFVGVLFPGLVQNHEKAIQCLGGIKHISEVCGSSKKRLGLSFQPDNPFIKKAFSDNKKSSGVLLKVKVKKTMNNNEIKREVVSTTVLGRVTQMHRFEAMCDFQYLPVQMDASGSAQCIQEKIIPSGLDTLDILTREEDTGAPHILPAQISRLDKPFPYRYTEKKFFGVKNSGAGEVCTRRPRGTQLVGVRFNLIDDLPTQPSEYQMQKFKARTALVPSISDHVELVKKKFDERPIWSVNALLYATKVKRASLKVILQYLAFFYCDGPWRALWVKYGYDPRKDPGSRIYQMLDFRIRRSAGVNSMVNKTDRCVKSEDVVTEGAVIFRPGIVLTQRQVFYQYCDIKLPEVEALLLVKPQPGHLCHSTWGWLPPMTNAVVRDHIFRYAKQMLLATHALDLKFEQGSSEDEANNSEDDDSSSMASFANEPSTSNT